MEKNIINEYVRNFDDLVDVIQKIKDKYTELFEINEKYIKLRCNDCDKEFYAEEIAYQCPYCSKEDLVEV